MGQLVIAIKSASQGITTNSMLEKIESVEVLAELLGYTIKIVGRDGRVFMINFLKDRMAQFSVECNYTGLYWTILPRHVDQKIKYEDLYRNRMIRIMLEWEDVIEIIQKML